MNPSHREYGSTTYQASTMCKALNSPASLLPATQGGRIIPAHQEQEGEELAKVTGLGPVPRRPSPRPTLPSSAAQGLIPSPWGHTAASGDVFGCHNSGDRGCLLSPCGQRPEMLLNTLQCTRQAFTSYPAQNISRNLMGPGLGCNWNPARGALTIRMFRISLVAQR